MLRKSIVGLALVLSIAGTSVSQERPSGRKPTGGKEGVNRGFEASAPKIGELLPDVAGFDADGNEFRLRSLRGHYSVLVFGCLT